MGRSGLYVPSDPGEMADFPKSQIDVSPTSITSDEATPRRRRKVQPLPQDDVAFSAVARNMPARVAKALEHAKLCARLADDNRGKDILLLDLRAATPLIDFFVIVSAHSRRQAYAISSEIDQELKKLGEVKLGIEGAEEGRWILTDYGDFVVHVFSEDARSYYALEEIWGDAPQVDWRDPSRKPRPTASRAVVESLDQADPEVESDPTDETSAEAE